MFNLDLISTYVEIAAVPIEANKQKRGRLHESEFKYKYDLLTTQKLLIAINTSGDEINNRL